MTVVSILPDGRIIAKANLTSQYIASGAGNQSVTITDLRSIETILAVNIKSVQAATSVSVIGQGITNNAIGLTINVGANTTITSGEVVAIGF